MALASILPTIQTPNKLFLSGPFGSGKTTLAVERVRWLLSRERIRSDDILILVPQRTLAQPYSTFLRPPNVPPGPPVRISTVAGLGRAAVELYWPLIAASAGFEDPKREPTFLNLETSQYHMAQFVDAALAAGEFDAIRVERSRVISQVLDNLNKAALHGFSIDEAYERLELAVPSGQQRTARLNALRAARGISQNFRQLCLRATLVDFSLQVELFNRQVLTNDWSRTHLLRSHRHLIYDNMEEDNSTAHRLIRQWLPQLDTALLMADQDAGFRIFLGADPEGILELANLCDDRPALHETFVMYAPLAAMARRVDFAVRGPRALRIESEPAEVVINSSADGESTLNLESALDLDSDSPPVLVPPEIPLRFYPQMINWIVGRVRYLVEEEAVNPGQIAILAPYVSDALRFSLEIGLEKHGIAITSHRPSRALQAEPATRCLLTLAALAHPQWNVRPPAPDVTLTLTLCIERLDPVRAHLLSQLVYPPRKQDLTLGRFAALPPAIQGRISYAAGEAYEHLRDWIYTYRASTEVTPLDQFFARLFGELLSQPGYGFHDDFDSARVANQLVQSARNFRWALDRLDRGGSATSSPSGESTDEGKEYLRLLQHGALGALYVPGWREAEDAVFVAPAYTFLMRNRPVDIQFWLDIGSSGWWERLYQPLTHPYVLSQRWPAQQAWSDFDEYGTRQEAMRRLLLGLIRRVRRRVYLGISDYGESGYEQRGPLLTLINRLLIERENPGAMGIAPGLSTDANEEGFTSV